MTFDKYFNKPLPKMTFQEGMRDRCISVYSAGKIFSATGMRSGWIIGPQHLIQAARSVHQFNVYCFYNVVENVATRSIQHISQPGNGFMEHEATRLRNSRNVMIK
jgi:aspartate/methionine/tyrosine aminotransferase